MNWEYMTCRVMFMSGAKIYGGIMKILHIIVRKNVLKLMLFVVVVGLLWKGAVVLHHGQIVFLIFGAAK